MLLCAVPSKKAANPSRPAGALPPRASRALAHSGCVAATAAPPRARRSAPPRIAGQVPAQPQPDDREPHPPHQRVAARPHQVAQDLAGVGQVAERGRLQRRPQRVVHHQGAGHRGDREGDRGGRQHPIGGDASQQRDEGQQHAVLRQDQVHHRRVGPQQRAQHEQQEPPAHDHGVAAAARGEQARPEPQQDAEQRSGAAIGGGVERADPARALPARGDAKWASSMPTKATARARSRPSMRRDERAVGRHPSSLAAAGPAARAPGVPGRRSGGVGHQPGRHGRPELPRRRHGIGVGLAHHLQHRAGRAATAARWRCVSTARDRAAGVVVAVHHSP